jgi:hypothetical protein
LIGGIANLDADGAKAVIDQLLRQLRLIANSKGITLADA